MRIIKNGSTGGGGGIVIPDVLDTAIGTHYGAVPPGETVFLSESQLVDNEIPLYVVHRNCTLVKVVIHFGIANGPSGPDPVSDIFTIYKNGVATTMTDTLDDDTDLVITTNTQALVVGDLVSLHCVFAANSLAEGMVAELIFE